MTDALGYPIAETASEHVRNALQILETAQRWTTDHHGAVMVLWPDDYDAVRRRLGAAMVAYARDYAARRAELDAMLAQQDRNAAILNDLASR